MARGLIGAALLSGFGQGAAQVAQTGMQFYGASLLQRERAELEEKRMARMEEYASAREARGYAHSEQLQRDQQGFLRGQKQEDIGADILKQDRTFQASAREKELDRIATAEENQKTRTAQSEDKAADRDVAVAKAESEKQHHAAVERHQQALEALTARHYDNERDRVTHFMTGKDGEYIGVTASGKSVPVKGLDGEPLKGPKDLTAQAKALADLAQKEGDSYIKNAADPMLSETERAEMRQQGRAAYARAASYLGEKPPEKKGPVQIVDPFAKPDQPKTMDASAPALKKPADDYLAMRRQETQQRADALREQTQQAGLAAMNAENPGSAVPTSPMREGPPAPVVAQNVPRELPRANPQVAAEPSFAPKMERQKLAMEQPRGLMAEAVREEPTQAIDKPSIAPTNGTTGEPTPAENQRKPSATESPYEAEITAAAQKYGIRPALLREVLRQESNFNPKAVNPKSGTKGLGQFQDATARQYGITDPFDANQSIDGAAHYLADLGKKYDNNETKMLAAYNFGPGNVDKGKALPAETQNYVKAILAKATDAAEQNAQGQSFDDLLKGIPAEKREYVMNELDQAVTLLRDGKISEDQFKGRVLAAYAAVPNQSGMDWSASASALARGLLAEARSKR